MHGRRTVATDGRSLFRSAAAAAFAVAAFCAFVAAAAPSRAADSDVPGRVVLARTEGDALLIWDSSPEVTAIVTDKQPKIAGAKTITVRVVYSKTGDVSPVYGSPTFAGVERFATLKIDAADATSDRDKWKELGDNAAPPARVKFDVVGGLPPR